MTDAILGLGVTELSARIRRGEISAEAVTEAYLQRIELLDAGIGGYLHVDKEGALRQAEAVDRRRNSGEALGALAGIPLALKDNLCIRGLPTTCGSQMLSGYVPPYDAHVVERLRGADAVFLGKTNMDEFAMGSSNEHSAFHVCRNPWDLSRAPGGSSGGSAAVTAAGLAAASLGSDTGGSVRQPAALCGVTALKPTYGRVSRHGLVAFASSLDQVGPFGRRVKDVAQLMDAIAGPDPRDATCLSAPYASCADALAEAPTMRIGVARDVLEHEISDEVRAGIETSIAALKDAGHEIVDVALPHAKYAISIYYLIAPAEASSNLARFDGIRYGLRAPGNSLIDSYEKTRSQGFGPEVQRRIMLGTYALSSGYYDAYYIKAQKARTRIREDFIEAFSRCDVILTPTTPTTAFSLGEKTSDPMAMYAADICTLPASLAGVPALSTPCGLGDSGLPIGVQLTAFDLQESKLFQVARDIEARCAIGAPARFEVTS